MLGVVVQVVTVEALSWRCRFNIVDGGVAALAGWLAAVCPTRGEGGIKSLQAQAKPSKADKWRKLSYAKVLLLLLLL